MEKFEFKRIKNESSNEELEVCKCRFVGRMKRSLRMLKSRRKKRKGCELMEKFVKERRFVGRVERFAEKFENAEHIEVHRILCLLNV